MKPSANRFRPRTFVLCFAPVIVTLTTAHAAEGLFSSGAFTSDATSGVSTAKTYTALANVVGGNVVVNGATFVGAGTSGTGWSLSGIPTPFSSGGNKTTTFAGQAITGLFDGFQYAGNPGLITLSGLTVGQTYVTTLYCQDWSWPAVASRDQTVTGSEGGSVFFNEDALEASMLRYTFVASAATMTLNDMPSISGNSFHLYGLSNEQVFNKSWTSGANWTTAVWSAAGNPNSSGANALFSAQGAPTAINLDASQTLGHVQFDGANPWTLSTGNASVLTLQADTAGLSILSAKSGAHTISAPVTFASDVMKSGPGTVALSGAITDAGKNITINAGTLEIANGTSQTLSGVISGPGTLAKSGAGTLTLTRPETYTGNTLITGGVLKLQSAAVTVGTASFKNFPSYTFSAAPNNLLASLTPTGTNASAGQSGTGTHNVLTDGAVPAFTFPTTYTVGTSAALTYSLGSSPTGYDLTAANLFSGWADNGRANINITNISYSTVASPGTFTAITGSADAYGGGGAANRAALTASTGVLATGVFAVQINFATQQNGYVGYRELEVTGTATGSVLPIGSAVQIASGGTLDLNGTTQTVGSLADSGGGGGTVNNSAPSTPVTISFNPASGSTTFSGTISDTSSANAVSLLKSGNGTQTLSGSSSYRGTTILVGGILNAATFPNFGANGSLGNRASDATGNVGLLFRGGTLQYNGSTAQSTNRSIRLSTTGGGGTIDASGSIPSATLSFTAAASADFFENSGTRTLTLTGSNTGANTFGMAINQAGTTHLVKNGAGTWVLTGANNYNGVTSLNAGTLRITTSAGLGAGGFSGTTITNIANNAALDLQGDLTITEHFHMQGAGPVGLGVLHSISGTTSFTTNFALDNNSTFGVDAGTLTIAAQIYHDVASAGITKIGTGTLVFSGNNIYTGATVISAGTLTASGGSAIINTGAVSLADTAGAIFNLATSETIGSLAGGGTTGGNVTLGSTTLTTGGANTTTAYAGVISGTGGSLVKTGTGTLTLTGANTYTGDTTVTAGTLAVTGNSIADTNKLVLNGGKMDIAAAANETVNTLYFGNVIQPLGTYGSTSSAATYKDDSRFSGTGIVTVITGPYGNWINGYPSITGGGKLSGADPDSDGFTNLQEFAFDTDPSISSSAPIVYASGVVTGHGQPTTSITNIENGVDFRAVFGRRKDYVTAGLTYTVQFSAGLDIWVNSTDTPNILATDTTIDAVSVPYPFFIPTANGVEKPTFFHVGVSSN